MAFTMNIPSLLLPSLVFVLMAATLAPAANAADIRRPLPMDEAPEVTLTPAPVPLAMPMQVPMQPSPAPYTQAPAQMPGWQYLGTGKLATRAGDLRIDAEAYGNMRRFTAKLNGRPFLLIDNQPENVRVSEVFHLDQEDAVVLTAYRGAPDCRYRNYLITLDTKGVLARPHEFESCAATHDVHMAHNAVFIRFAETMNPDGFDRWDVWRYENGQLVRL